VNVDVRLIDFKPQTQPQTTEKPTKKPKKSKRDADAPSRFLINRERILIAFF
jgi:hypothetical protein